MFDGALAMAWTAIDVAADERAEDSGYASAGTRSLPSQSSTRTTSSGE